MPYFTFSMEKSLNYYSN